MVAKTTLAAKVHLAEAEEEEPQLPLADTSSLVVAEAETAESMELASAHECLISEVQKLES